MTQRHAQVLPAGQNGFPRERSEGPAGFNGVSRIWWRHDSMFEWKRAAPMETEKANKDDWMNTSGFAPLPLRVSCGVGILEQVKAFTKQFKLRATTWSTQRHRVQTDKVISRLTQSICDRLALESSQRVSALFRRIECL